jgi:hypothetical protein
MGGPLFFRTGFFLIVLLFIGFKFVSFSCSSLPEQEFVQQMLNPEDCLDFLWLLLNGSMPASPVSITDFIEF